MLINKLQTPEDVGKFRRIPPQKLEDSIRLFVESCQEFGIAKEAIVDKLAEKYRLEPEEAGKMVEMYYKQE